MFMFYEENWANECLSKTTLMYKDLLWTSKRPQSGPPGGPLTYLPPKNPCTHMIKLFLAPINRLTPAIRPLVFHFCPVTPPPFCAENSIISPLTFLKLPLCENFLSMEMWKLCKIMCLFKCTILERYLDDSGRKNTHVVSQAKFVI